MAKRSVSDVGGRLSNKRRKVKSVSNGQEEAKEDRLSALPDCQILHILSFLLAEQVAMTCLLSKRWQHLWTEMPVLDFCHPFLGTETMVHKVDRMLAVCNGHRLNKFAIDFWYEACFSSSVDLWFQFLINNKVKNITLRCQQFSLQFYVLPEILYSYSSLMSLTLYSVAMAPRVAIEWGCLKTLSLDEVELCDSLMTNIFSGCPVLEVLHLKVCWGLSYLNICARNLTTLLIENWVGVEISGSFLEISAPYVRVLSILEDYGEEIEFRLKNISSVVQANLDFRRQMIMEPCSSPSDMNYVNELIESVKSVKDLELGPWCIEVLSSMEMKSQKFPPSTRRCLTLNAWDHTGIIPGIVGMLKSSPNLETLVIKGIPSSPKKIVFKLTSYRAATFLRRGKLDLVACHLKTVKITGFTDTVLNDVTMLELVQMLQKSSKVLEKMVISAVIAPP